MPTSTGSEIQKSSIMAGGQAASALQRFSASALHFTHVLGSALRFQALFCRLFLLRWIYEITIDLRDVDTIDIDRPGLFAADKAFFMHLGGATGLFALLFRLGHPSWLMSSHVPFCVLITHLCSTVADCEAMILRWSFMVERTAICWFAAMLPVVRPACFQRTS